METNRVMDEATAKKLMERAKIVTIRAGYPDQADDFAQWCMLKFVEGKRKNSRLDYMYIDYLRETLGHEVRSVHKYAAANNMVPLFDEEGNEMYSREVYQQHDMDFNTIADEFEDIERATLILHYKWGLQLKEIGELFKVTESRICQILTKVNKLVAKRHGTA